MPRCPRESTRTAKDLQLSISTRNPRPRRRGDRMRRRDIIALLGGSLIAQPLATRAQQKAMPVIGFLLPSCRAYSAPYVAAFHEGLNEFGYIEGKTLPS